jgi:hypothetical protein
VSNVNTLSRLSQDTTTVKSCNNLKEVSMHFITSPSKLFWKDLFALLALPGCGCESVRAIYQGRSFGEFFKTALNTARC